MEKKLYVSGTTCRSCELLIEERWRALPGVDHVKVNSATGEATVSGSVLPSNDTLNAALKNTNYCAYESARDVPAQRTSVKELVVLFGLVLLAGYILSKLGFVKTNIALGASLGFASVFLMGLIAASSSCVAVVGGLLISSAARFNERYKSYGAIGRMRPVIIFVLGRIASYTILGGLLGALGSFVSPSPLITASITILAALYMIIMGLDMLHVAPRFLKRLLPTMVKRVSRSILENKKNDHWAMPFALGAATFFLPCGFTQALQLYSLTTHSFWVAASLLFAFSLGTAPALLALGFASGSVRGPLGRWLFKFSGALVVVLGIFNIQNAIALAGFAPEAQQPLQSAAMENFNIVNGEQIVRMRVTPAGYEPGYFTVKAGVPVRWEITGTEYMGCASVLVSRQLRVEKLLTAGLNVITFTPRTPGKIPFSCSMGMFRGNFTVVN